MGLHRGARQAALTDRMAQREARQPKTHYGMKGFERTACGLPIKRKPFAQLLDLSLREENINCDRCFRSRFA